MALFRTAGADFWKGGHGVAADFFGRVGKEGEEPLTNGLLKGRLLGQREASANGSDERDAAKFFFGGCEIESGNLFLPKTQPGYSAELPVKVLGELGGLLGHRRASV